MEVADVIIEKITVERGRSLRNSDSIYSSYSNYIYFRFEGDVHFPAVYLSSCVFFCLLCYFDFDLLFIMLVHSHMWYEVKDLLEYVLCRFIERR